MHGRITPYLLVLLPSLLHAAEIYESRDARGRPVFTDTPPAAEYTPRTVEIENDVRWRRLAPLADKIKPRKRSRGRSRAKRKRRYSFDELRRRCTAASARYHNYRGNGGNSDWESYKAKLARYAQRRDYWCKRLLKGR